MLENYNEKLIAGINLTEQEMMDAMRLIMEGNVSDIEISAFLIALKIKGESITEITAGAKVLREKVQKVNLEYDVLVDTCGTGGDGLKTYNISTVVSMVLASSGVKVVKHGNRSVSSKCGSADILETLGVNIEVDSHQLKKCMDEANITFLYARKYHSAMKNVANVRKTLGLRTIFNILGPLSNPASATHQIIGVYDKNLCKPFAEVLKNLGLERALVVHGADGLDEISISEETYVAELKDEEIVEYVIKPEDFDLESFPVTDIVGGDVEENKQIVLDLLDDKLRGAKYNILLLNSGAALYVSGRASSIGEGIELARQLLSGGEVKKTLEEFGSCSRSNRIYLEDIIETKRDSIKKDRDYKDLYKERKIKDFKGALEKKGLSIIGEIKKASPSLGLIKEDFNHLEIAKEYNEVVDMISVLTEEDYFKGSFDYLRDVSENVEIPVLCKDFMLVPNQIYKAHYYGADCILLIVAVLTEEELSNLYELATSLGLSCLVEVHTEEELERALKINPNIIGINNRDLKTFKTNLDMTKKLAALVPKDIVLVTESGIHTDEDIKYLDGVRYNGALIGESFMKSDDIKKHAKDLKDAYSS